GLVIAAVAFAAVKMIGNTPTIPQDTLAAGDTSTSTVQTPPESKATDPATRPLSNETKTPPPTTPVRGETVADPGRETQRTNPPVTDGESTSVEDDLSE